MSQVLLKELTQRASSLCKDNEISTYMENIILVAKQMEQEFQEQGLEKSALYMKQTASDYELSLEYHKKRQDELIKETQKATDEIERAFGKKEVKPSTLNEPELEDDYSMFGGYYYVADGKVIVAELTCDVGHAKNMFGYSKICRCDMVERGLSPLVWMV